MAVGWYSERRGRLYAEEEVAGLEVGATEIVERRVADNRLQVKVG